METTRYTYDNNSQLIGEFVLNSNGTPNENSALTTEYLYLGNMPLAVIKRSNKTDSISWIVADHLNSPKFVINKNYGLNWKWNTEPFGSTLPIETNGFKMNLRFPGQVYDKETGTHYNVFRDYDPQSGRYLQTDPIGLSGGMNRWGYVGGNPLRYTDRLGLEVDLNYISPDEPLHHYMNNIPSDPLSFLVGAHANPNAIYNNHKPVNLKELAEIIRRSGKKNVILISCESGQKDNGPAKQLKDFLGKGFQVAAPDQYAWVTPQGTYGHVAQINLWDSFLFYLNSTFGTKIPVTPHPGTRGNWRNF